MANLYRVTDTEGTGHKIYADYYPEAVKLFQQYNPGDKYDDIEMLEEDKEISLQSLIEKVTPDELYHFFSGLIFGLAGSDAEENLVKALVASGLSDFIVNRW